MNPKFGTWIPRRSGIFNAAGSGDWMLDEALRDLKIDRRMLERRGWITRQERAAAFAALQDAADKVAPQEEAPPEPPRSEG